MTFLLHYFTSQNCITRDQILIWYNYKDLRRCLDFDGAKLLMTPYVESLSNNNSGRSSIEYIEDFKFLF